MKKIIFLLLISVGSVEAQNSNIKWCFGDSAGIDFTNSAMPFSTGMDGRGSCVSISDSVGNLILYAFTVGSSGAWSTRIFNSNHISIAGADSITGEAWYNELILIPKPGCDSIYYLFSIGIEQNINQGLYLTIIDMRMNGNLGGIVQQNIQINNYVYADCLTAVKNGNGRDWWIIGKHSNINNTITNKFITHLIKTDSISYPIIQDFNDAYDETWQKIVWHPSKNKFMLIHNAGYMSEFGFDRCNGVISLNQNIFPEQWNNFNRLFWEGAYSPNGNIFYVSRTSYGGNFGNYNYLLQYDLTAANIPASCDTLDSTMYPPVDCGAVRLAPDGKIYYSQAYIPLNAFSYPYADSIRNYINENLGVINNPDVAGSGCNFAPFSFYLGGKRTYYGLPNNPNYSLGPLAGSPCDTLTGIKEVAQKNKNIKLHVAPNPVTKTLYFNAEQVSGHTAYITIQNTLGALVFKKEATVLNGGYVTLPITVSGFTNGIYIITLQTDYAAASAKFIKE
jgi:hypothetical protein